MRVVKWFVWMVENGAVLSRHWEAMMRMLFGVFMCTVITWGGMHAIGSTRSDFETLLSYYSDEEEQVLSLHDRKLRWHTYEGVMPGKLIDPYLAEHLLGFEGNEIANRAYAGEILFQNDRYIGLTYIVLCGAGGACDATYLATLSLQGEFIGVCSFSYSYVDISGGSLLRNSYHSDSLIVSRKYHERHAEDGPDVSIEHLVVREQTISEEGVFGKCSEFPINTDRQYYWLSTSVVPDSTLMHCNATELALMRNEIYAAHGYIFDSRKWSDYFAGKQWYTPAKMDVSDDLTWLERKNLDAIMARERTLQ